MVGLLCAMGVHVEPSFIHTLPGACGLSSLRDEVRTVPGLAGEVGCVRGQALPCTEGATGLSRSIFPKRKRPWGVRFRIPLQQQLQAPLHWATQPSRTPAEVWGVPSPNLKQGGGWESAQLVGVGVGLRPRAPTGECAH